MIFIVLSLFVAMGVPVALVDQFYRRRESEIRGILGRTTTSAQGFTVSRSPQGGQEAVSGLLYNIPRRDFNIKIRKVF